jgi:hypothetical protein
MTIAAMRGVAGMLSTDWWMNQGQSSEAAEARAGEWRRHVVNHIWGVLAEAERLPDRGDRVAQPADQE